MALHVGDPRKLLQFSGHFPADVPSSLPYLVLAIDQREVQLQLLFEENRTWYDIEWQGGGVECWVHLPLTCTILEPRPEVHPSLVTLSEKWLCSSLGSRWAPSLDRVLEYRSDLLDLGFDCDATYRDVAEATYPFDLGPTVLRRLCCDDLPEDLNDLVLAVGYAGRGEWPPDDQRIGALDHAWRVFLLGPNAD